MKARFTVQRETPAAAAVREVAEETGLRVRVVRPLCVVRHAYSHFSVTLHAFECRPVAGAAAPRAAEALKWVRAAELERYPFPRANRRIADAILARARGGTGGGGV